MSEYTANELMICVTARMMEDSTTAFIGTGIPMLAAVLAQRLYAPNLIFVFEFGGIGAQLVELPLAVGESRTFHKALVASGICDLMGNSPTRVHRHRFPGRRADRYVWQPEQHRHW